MKRILFILMSVWMCANAQVQYKINADTTVFRSVGNTGNEIRIENDSRDTLGVFQNKGSGRTQFLSYAALKNLLGVTAGTDTQSLHLNLYPGQFNLSITRGNSVIFKYAVDTIYRSGDSLIATKINGVRIPLYVPIDIDYISKPFHLLNSLMTNDSLLPGKTYLLNNFETIYDQPDYDNAGAAKGTVVTKTASTEYLVFKATSDSTFASEVSSLNYPNDKLKFDWTFIATEIMAAAAKGRIIERIDEFNNRTDYDHRKVLFLRYRNGDAGYSSWKDNDSVSAEFPTFDLSIASNNHIGDFAIYRDPAGIDAPPFMLPNNVFTDFTLNNYFAPLNYNITVTHLCIESYFELAVFDITAIPQGASIGFGYTRIGSKSHGLLFVGYTTDNHLWGMMADCSFGNDFKHNFQKGILTNSTFGDNNTYNFILGNNDDLTFGSTNDNCTILNTTSFNLGSSNSFFNNEFDNVQADNTATLLFGEGANGEVITRTVASIAGGSETVVELGTIGFAAINAAPATNTITLQLTTNDFPQSTHYAVAYYFNATTPFDAPTAPILVDGMLNFIPFSTLSALFGGGAFDLTAGAEADYTVNTLTALNFAQRSQADYTDEITFSFGGGANPQDYTQGSVTVYAIMKAY